VLLGSYNENFTDVHTTYYLPNGNPFILDPNYWNTFDPVRFGYYDLITAGYTLTPGTDYQLLFFAGWDTGQQAGIPNSFILNDMEISFSSTKLRKGGSPSPSSANGTPEPAAGILALFGLGLLAFRRRRR
jgi:MYXO-CTERM domain-containing protein